MNRTALIVIVLLVILGGVVWWMTGSDGATGTNPEVNTGASSVAPGAATTTGSNADLNAAEEALSAVTVSYDGTSFSPQNVTVHVGGTVTWKNASASTMWVASAMHPGHAAYDGTDRATHCAAGYTGEKPFDQCKGDGDYSFTFNKEGEFKYHDHITPSAFGSVKVVD